MKKIISIMLVLIHLTYFICNLSLASEYQLGSNDTLEIKIIGKPDLTTKQTVTPDGSISLPIIGRIKVKDMTLSQLDEYLTTEFSIYIQKPQIIVYLTTRPIYVIQHDIKKNTWDVKEAKSIEEARALAGQDYAGSINYGDIVSVNVSKEPDFWEANWYRVITATAVLVGIYATISR